MFLTGRQHLVDLRLIIPNAGEVDEACSKFGLWNRE